MPHFEGNFFKKKGAVRSPKKTIFQFDNFRTMKQIDLIIYNTTIYTVNNDFEIVEAIAIDKGRIIATGSNDFILKNFTALEKIDAQGQYAYPGLIDPHCHLLTYAKGLDELDLLGVTSAKEMVEKARAFYQQHPHKKAIIGRKWDQNLWENKAFPDKSLLDKYFPDIPVLLTRIDGHAALANQKTLDIADVTIDTQVSGGIFEQKNGQLTGLLIDHAIAYVANALPQLSPSELSAALIKAQHDCFKYGLTSIGEAWIDKETIDLIDNLQQAGSFKLRMYCMAIPEKKAAVHYFKHGTYATDKLTMRTFKFFADGALGSRGAWLLAPYSDDALNYGLQLLDKEQFTNFCQQCYEHGFQVNTHCIGDAANRFVLDVYGGILKGKNDRRWRIEHAQILHPDDLHKFGKYSIVPSVQTTHATSDMYWVGERIGQERLKKAYAYKELLEQNGWLPNGSDFPIEQVNPLLGFYAAIARQDAKGFPEGGFQIENSLNHKETLKAMTIWAAYANFEEASRGSLEAGKWADMVFLDRDIMEVPLLEILETKVLRTYVGGERVY